MIALLGGGIEQKGKRTHGHKQCGGCSIGKGITGEMVKEKIKILKKKFNVNRHLLGILFKCKFCFAEFRVALGIQHY